MSWKSIFSKPARRIRAVSFPTRPEANAFVRMLVHVLIFFNTVNGNVCMSAFDAALDALFEFICDVRNA